MKHTRNHKLLRIAAGGASLVMLLSALAACEKAEEPDPLNELGSLATPPASVSIPGGPAVPELTPEPGTDAPESDGGAMDAELPTHDDLIYKDGEIEVFYQDPDGEPGDFDDVIYKDDTVEVFYADPDYSAAYAAYADVVEAHATELLGYRQIQPSNFDGVVEDEATRAIALVDIMGDSTPELVLIAGDELLPSLLIFSYENGAARLVLEHEYWDMSASMETAYCLYQIDGVKDLFAAKAGDENGFYHWYSEDGETLIEESLLRPAVYDVREYSYYLNDAQITQEQYEAWLAEFPQTPDTLVMYNLSYYMDGRELADAVGMKPVALTYDEAIALLRGASAAADGSAAGLPASILDTAFVYWTGPRSSYMLAFYSDGSYEFKDSGVAGMSGDMYEIDIVGQIESAEMISDTVCELRIASCELLGYATDLGQTAEDVILPFRAGDVVKLILPGAGESAFDADRAPTFAQMQSYYSDNYDYDGSCYYVYMNLYGVYQYVPFERG